ncbi:MAG: hypothetical protein HRT89_05935 [Lentisphaeria bacterium]|nr:hypothetical protein [Lentisphaeria bacterium]NQZ67592.1 hypothetical protein [Lentisphaeria bacterium]
MKKILIILALLLGIPLAAKDKILVCRKASSQFKDAYDSINAEVSEDYETVDYVIDKATTYAQFKAKIDKLKPALLVLMDNQAVKYAMAYNKEDYDYAQKLKGVAIMALNLRKILKGNKNICGIEYEVPAYTLVTSFRHIVDADIGSVTVFYRGSQHKEMIAVATAQLKKEGLELHAIDAEDKGADVRKVARYLIKNVKNKAKKAELIWVIPDSGMLNKLTFGPAWVKTARTVKTPFLTGIDKFASPKMNFCTYSASPNHKDLGTQAGEMILSVLEGEEPVELGVEYILSVLKSVNVTKLEELGISLKHKNLKNVRILK